MRSQKNKVKNSAGSASSRTQTGSRSDVDSRLLQQLSSKMGNSGLGTKLQQTAQERDVLLQLIGDRLKNIQHTQQIELDEVALRPEWFRNVAKGENGFFLPDPTRWKEVAQTYKQAGQALCRGDVSRGKQLLEQALEKEDAVQKSLPVQVTERLESDESTTAETPISTASEGNEICASRNPTRELAIADEIIAVRATVKNAPPIRRTRPFNWWEQQEESEEESQEHETQQEPAQEQDQETELTHEQESPAPTKNEHEKDEHDHER